MTIDPKALEAAARAYCTAIGLDYDRISPPLALKRDEATRAAIVAYQSVVKKARLGGAHKIAMAVRDIEEGNLAAVHFNGQTWRPAPAWQPIDTAPKERGAKILGWCVFPAGAEVRLCQNSPSYLAPADATCWYAYGMTQEVTHWMPLPPPPERSGRNLADATQNQAQKEQG